MMLEVKSIAKSFKNTQALDDISFSIAKGDVFGIIGPNGSGKTTTLSIVLNLLTADSGSVLWSERFDVKKIGAYLESTGFDPKLTVWNNLKLSAIIKNVYSKTDLENALTLVGLLEKKNEVFKNLSLGMKQRLAIATTFLGHPELIILDEPTNGLDPLGIIEVRNLILDLNKKGKTIIIASHILTEMEKLCNRVAIYNKGKIVAVERVDSLLKQYGSLENAFLSLTK